MKKGRIKRNIATICIFLATLSISLLTNFSPAKINNFTDLMSASLSFSSIATALFFSCFSLIPAFTNSQLVKKLKQLKWDYKVMDKLMHSSLIFLISSIFSFIELFFCSTDNSRLSQIVTAIWISTTITGLFNTVFLVLLLIKLFDLATDE
ncbi:hypothetical protein A6M16_00260 [Streptococcus suis]|uniref:SepS25A protein n=2 Tax=Streptococcus suis TaxID=1307 RepID=Q5H7Z7_STRSU|nr:hypothetical protein A6M16_00260 [Streptococcus suis]AOM73750.1 hypothetical protein BFP66_00150 [Streptococcus suis]MBS8058832.1 hypothetical protein [Streptococcus suis]MBS8114179.1 hypothetical protein [Streptococcus suis]BAD88697.1 sepS25A [Streptococcus suis]